MLIEHLEGNIKFTNKSISWEDSIRLASEILLEKEYITKQYIEKMINNVYEYGPYIVITPGFAMPHAKNENNEVIQTSISLLNIKKSVLYPKNNKVSLVMVLAAKDTSEHLELISSLSSLLMEDHFQEKMENANNEEEVIKTINDYMD